MKVSCVLPIRNEEQYLPYSLPHLNRLNVEEILFVLDRCADNSESLIMKFGNSKTRITHKTDSAWSNQCAETKAYGCSKAKYPLVLMSDADVILDSDCVEPAKHLLQTQNCIVMLSYRQYSLGGTVLERLHDELVNFIGLFVRRVRLQPCRGGIYMARKDSLNLEDYPSEYDILQQKYRVVSLETKTLHLRPRHSREAQIQRGKARAGLPQYNVLKILLVSLLELQPYMLFAYLREHKK